MYLGVGDGGGEYTIQSLRVDKHGGRQAREVNAPAAIQSKIYEACTELVAVGAKKRGSTRKIKN